MGKVFVGTMPENLAAIRNAQTPLDYGRPYGYSDDDIAAFYVRRRGGDVEQAYKEYTEDFTPRSESKGAAEAPPAYSDAKAEPARVAPCEPVRRVDKD